MTVTEVTAKRSDLADDPDAVRSPEPGSREPAGRRLRIIPFLITLAAVALAGLLGWAMWGVYIVRTFGAESYQSRLHEAGIAVGSSRVQELARQANRSLPELRTHDRFGQRVDRIDFHPAWHELMGLAIAHDTHALCWNEPGPGAQVARAALSYLWNQGENGICCPISMTYSAVPILQGDPERWREWGKLITSKRYDGRQIRAVEKTGATVGMAMTEKQGGSDLRQTQTRAMPNGDGSWSLVGHKWFFSVPHSDVFLTLAQTPEGISCFVVAGWLPDGSRNRLQIQRLKDKCGNKSNASSEVEFRGAVAHLIGEPGHGIRTGISMNHFTRLDFAVGSSGLMRQAVAQAAQPRCKSQGLSARPY